jgi:hypothetical protein
VRNAVVVARQTALAEMSWFLTVSDPVDVALAYPWADNDAFPIVSDATAVATAIAYEEMSMSAMGA